MQTFQEADTNFAFMLREGILKENIDGEALLWAYRRIVMHPASRKIMFVISDGAPVDDSTLSVNAPDFLHRHLLSVVSSLSASKIVELRAVGVDHDVSAYYGSNSVALTSNTSPH